MKLIILTFILNFFAYTHNLEISVSNIQERKGQFIIAVFKDGKGYPDNGKKAVLTDVFGIDDLPYKTTLASGEYAISIYQDLNLNKNFDKKIFGIPKEPFGFSQNPTIFVGAPKYKNVKFQLGSETVNLDIELKYF